MCDDTDNVCRLCKRAVSRITAHHLIPKKLHRRKRFKRSFSKVELSHTVPLCIPCHKHIHTLFTEQELAQHYYSPELLLSHEEVAQFVRFISKKAGGYTARSRRAK